MGKISRPFLIILTVTFTLFLMILFKDEKRLEMTIEKQLRTHRNAIDLSEYIVKTYKGFVTMKELNEKVYKPLGYEIIRPIYPVPTLRMINVEPTCETVFSDWLTISEKIQPDDPPREIPAELVEQFLLYNFTALQPWYINDKNSEKREKPMSWNMISEMMKYPKKKLGGFAYGTQGVSIFNAMKAHLKEGQRGVVIGSMKPWVEVSALVNGAQHVLTVEYNKLEIPEEFKNRMSFVLTVDFVKNWDKYQETFDFAASFSSIEHSGLGRYGDPIDPFGDIREMMKVKCVLKKGALFFLGVPLGTDALCYNAHRIYGPIRLALMMYGFEWIATYNGDSEEPMELNSARLHEKQVFQMVQHTLVLRKL